MSRRALTIPAVTAEEVATWQPSKINAMLDRLDKINSKLVDQFIAEGRSSETPNETNKKDDPLALLQKRVWRTGDALRNEIARRYGPGAPRRLPRGFGPIRSI